MSIQVLVDEEYGYKYHIWTLDKSVEELAEWWRTLKSVTGFFFNPATQIPDIFSGSMVTMETEKDLDKWFAARRCTNIPFLFIHANDDSYLEVKGEQILHAGYKQPDAQDDWG